MSIPESIVREIERAIRGAEFPSGMSVHDGKAKVDSSHLRRLLAELAAVRAELASANRECEVRNERELGYLARAQSAEAERDALRTAVMDALAVLASGNEFHAQTMLRASLAQEGGR